MSATQTGDKPKRRRVPKVIDMGVERDIAVAEEIGTIKGALKHHEDRMDRSERATQDRFTSLENEVRAHAANSALEFKGQNAKLDILILRSAKEDGAQENEKQAEEHEKQAEGSQVSFWAKWSGFAIVVGTVAGILQPAVSWLRHIVTGH